jgi:transcription elongation GreA/GreB family factor
MSRAFVKEDEGEARALRVAPPLPPGVSNVITAAGAAAFAAQTAALRDQAEALSAAGRLGDGVAAAQRKALDEELRWREDRAHTFVITAPPDDPEVVSFGCAVEVEGARGRRWLRLLGVDELGRAQGAVSWRSPVGSALLGAALGDEVALRTPAGEERVEVLAIRPA